MKKSKIKLLTATACLALVGTASAAWVYAGTATASANIGVKVASYASAGEITVNNADNLLVYLDKGSVSFKKVDDTKAFSATYTKPDGFEDKTVTLTYTVTINSPLSTYINFQTAYGSTDGNNITSTVSNWTSDADLFENLPTLKWGMDDNNNTYGNFTSEEEYKTFIKNLNGTGVSEDWLNTDEVSVGELVTITFTATVS